MENEPQKNLHKTRKDILMKLDGDLNEENHLINKINSFEYMYDPISYRVNLQSEKPPAITKNPDIDVNLPDSD